MRDVIQKIVAAENQAKRIIEEGRAEADCILSEARRQAQDISMKAYQDAGRDAQEIIAEAAREAQGGRQRNIEKALVSIEQEVVIEEDLKRKIIEKIVRRVTGKEID